jgi:hypothetical protein
VSDQLHTPVSVPLGKEPPAPIEWVPEPLWIHWRVEMPLTYTGNLSTISWLSNTYPSQLTDLFVSVYHIVGPLAACVASCELFSWPSKLSRHFVNMAYRSQFINSSVHLDEMAKLVIKLLSDTVLLCIMWQLHEIKRSLNPCRLCDLHCFGR